MNSLNSPLKSKKLSSTSTNRPNCIPVYNIQNTRNFENNDDDNDENMQFSHSSTNLPYSVSQKNKNNFQRNNQKTYTLIGKKNFISKANYFGLDNTNNINNNNNNNNAKPISPSNSPMINYFSNLSPNHSKGRSPDENFADNKMSPFYSEQQTFNFSPSNIFNADFSNNNNNNINNNMNMNMMFNNFGFQSMEVIPEDTNKTLQEKMENLVSKNGNNYMNNIKNNNMKYNNFYNIQEQKLNNEDEDYDDNNEEVCVLSFSCDDVESNDEKKKTNNQQISKQENNNNNSSDNFNNSNNNIQNNTNDHTPLKTENDNSLKKIFKKNEFPKPYIPNKFRDKTQEINQINNISDENSLPSYGGPTNNNINNQQTNLYSNEAINYNNNINININNSNSNFIGFPIADGQMMMPNFNQIPAFVPSMYFQKIQSNENSPYPTKIGEFVNFPTRANNFVNEKNKFTMSNNNNINNFYNNGFSMNNAFDKNNSNENEGYNIFHYNGDNYQISQFKQYKKKDENKTGEISSISANDLVTTITANNKKIKRIDPNTYLNESLDYLSHNIFLLAKDQAGCRFLQEKLEKEPKEATEKFYNAILPYLISLVKDPFGNYLIQKLIQNLNLEQIIKILEIMSPTILDIGSNSHGTRVIQHLISYLKTKELVDYFLKSIEPYIIPLLKELNGTHIIQKFLSEHPECENTIHKIIIDNCASLASHRHGCCVLQKFLDGPDCNLKKNLINSLINNCLVLIIDQFGNYVIQSILLLNDSKASSIIALKICDNVAYYSKHRYSSNVVEKCFDFCGQNEKNKLIEKISPPDILADLIMDEHGNYVIQKALSCAEPDKRELILQNIIPLIPKIKCVSFGEKLLWRLMQTYPQLNTGVRTDNNNSNNNNSNSNNNNNNSNNNMNNNMNNNNNVNNNNFNAKNIYWNNNSYNNNGFYKKNGQGFNNNINKRKGSNNQNGNNIKKNKVDVNNSNNNEEKDENKGAEVKNNKNKKNSRGGWKPFP